MLQSLCSELLRADAELPAWINGLKLEYLKKHINMVTCRAVQLFKRISTALVNTVLLWHVAEAMISSVQQTTRRFQCRQTSAAQFLSWMHSNSVRNLLNKWPGANYFGIYRFLPLFFALGAALEFSMINWRVGQTNFCTITLIYICLHLTNCIELTQIQHSKEDRRENWPKNP